MKNKRKLFGLTATASLLSLSVVLASCNKTKEYKVTFKNGNEIVEEQPVQSGFNAKVPTAPTSGDLEFNGWYKDEAKTTPFDFGSIITEDTTVYANWVNKYKVTFNTNGGSTVKEATVKEGYNVAVPTAPTKAGYVFSGWFADADCTTPFDFGSIITKATTVYAKWDLAVYNVSLYTATGELYRTIGVTNGGKVGEFEAPTKEHKELVGWYTDAACTTEFDIENQTISGDISLYAKWEDLLVVTLYNEAGSVYKTVDVKEGALLNVEDPSIKYRDFLGWYTDASCEDDYLFNLESDPIFENTELYAKWEIQTEVVPYEFNYKGMMEKYGVGNKPTTIDRFGGFYAEDGIYSENSKKNPMDGDQIQDDINTQKKLIWFETMSTGKLTFDFKNRDSGNASISIYKLPKSAFYDAEKGEYNYYTKPVVTEEDKIWSKNDASNASVSVDLTEGAVYVISSTNNLQVHKLQYTDTVEKSAPTSIKVAGALNSFLCGDEFSSKGINASLIYGNGRTVQITIPTNGYDLSAVNMNQEGTYPVKVKYTASDVYGDYPLETTYDINVYAVDTIDAFTFGLKSNGGETVYNKLVYAVGETVSTSGITVRAKGTIGEGTSAVTFDKKLATSEWELASPVDTSTVGRKTVTLKYKYNEARTATFDIEVVEKLFNENSTKASVVVNGSVEKAEKSGDSYVFKTITEALQYFNLCGVPASATKEIVLKNGVYNEKVYVDMPNVVIKGEALSTQLPSTTQVGAGQNCPVITFNALNGILAPNDIQYSTTGAATFTLSANATNCTVAGVKIMNYYNTNALYQESLNITKDSQATACLVRGDMATFAWVSFSGYHDTLEAENGRQLYFNCDIEGRTDYIFGNDATAYFQGCTIRTLGAGLTEKNGGYVVATKGKEKMNYGYIFNECNFVADDQVQKGCVSIARGWDSYMKVMVMNCNLGEHISDGTYGQTYYKKTVTAEAFDDLVKIGLYTYNSETGKYSKITTEEFSATTDYYIQLNDRYTKMNKDPNPALLSEYNNRGAGAISYTKELADKYKAKTFTLLDPSDANTKSAMEKYGDMNTVFKADNGSVKYLENWNPSVWLDASLVANVTVNGVDNTNSNEELSLNLTNTYVDNTLVASQLAAIKQAIKDNLKDGYTLIGLYADSTYKTEFTESTVLTSTTTVYARVVKGTLIVTKEDFNVPSLITTEAPVGTEMEGTVFDGQQFSMTIAGDKCLVVKDYSKATTEDNSKEFEYGLITKSTFNTTERYYTITAKNSGTITLYYTFTDSKFGTADQSKKAKLSVDGQYVQDTDLNASNKIAYVHELTVEEGKSYKINTSTNRLAIFGVSFYKEVISQEQPTVETVTKTLDISKVSGTAYTVDTFINDIFTANPGVKSENAKIDGVSYSKQVSLTSGKVQLKDGVFLNGIKVELSEDSTITIVAGSKSDKTVALLVLGTDGKAVTPTELKKNGTAGSFDNLPKTKDLDTYTFVLPKGTYYIGGNGGGAYIYALSASWTQTA